MNLETYGHTEYVIKYCMRYSVWISISILTVLFVVICLDLMRCLQCFSPYFVCTFVITIVPLMNECDFFNVLLFHCLSACFPHFEMFMVKLFDDLSQWGYFRFKASLILAPQFNFEQFRNIVTVITLHEDGEEVDVPEFSQFQRK